MTSTAGKKPSFGPVQGYFVVTNGEIPSLQASTTGSNDDGVYLSPHERALLQKAQAFQGSKQTYVIVDSESQEIRMGNDRTAVKEGTPGVQMERIYFHELREVTDMNESTIRVVMKKPGIEKVIIGAHVRELKEALRTILSQYKVVEPPGSVSPSTGKSEFSYVALFSIPLFTLALQIIAAHALFSPFTKVEESFNVQATHDLLRYPEGLTNRTILRHSYDHIEFPGVVPRTFTGPWFLSSIYRIFDSIIPRNTIHDGLVDLIVIRLILGVCFMVVSVSGLYHATRKAFPNSFVPVWYVLLQFSQFHVPFYATRLLPNTFAMILCMLAHAQLLRGRYYASLATMIATFVIFRCDVLLLLAPTAVWVWLTVSAEKPISVKTLFWVGLRMFFFALVVFCLTLGFTVVLDTHMWDKEYKNLFWPEGMVLFFNTVLNKSSEWGTEPFHWYFTSALPKALLGAFPLVPFGLVLGAKNKRFLGISLPSIVFVVVYSALPHKEVRFLFPVLPALTLTAAVGFDGILVRSRKSFRSVLIAGFIVACLASFLVSVFYSYLSSLNYPGGYALQWLHQNVHGSGTQSVHIDPYCAMSGISRFGQVVSSKRFAYFKKEHDVQYTDYDYLITNNPAKVIASTNETFKVIHSESGEPRPLLPSTQKLLELVQSPPATFGKLFSAFIHTRPVVFVMQKKGSEQVAAAEDAPPIPSASAF